MPRNANQKLKLLYLARILEENTDEGHPMTINDLIDALDRCGVPAERKSVYDDIAALEQFGYDIVTERRRGNAYYLGQRKFETPELKLLVDAVQSAKFISESKSRALIKKICTLTSCHEGGLMQRQVHVQGRAKTINERTYYSVDTIQTAIAENRQIAFKYYEWTVDPKAGRRFSRRWRHGGQPYQVSPWTLLWDDEYYYLIAFDEAAGFIKHYRVDKMADISATGEARVGRQQFEALDIAEYTKSTFGMFGGEDTDVKLCFANHLVGVVVDRFGADILITPSGDDRFTVMVKAKPSPQFLSWLFGFGAEVQVLHPPQVARQLQETAQAVLALYKPGQ